MAQDPQIQLQRADGSVAAIIWEDSSGNTVIENFENDTQIEVTEDGLAFSGDTTLVHDRLGPTTNYTTDGSGYYTMRTDSAGSPLTLTLASADAVDGLEINAKRDGPDPVTIETEGTETIDGSNSIKLTNDKQTVTLVYNGDTGGWEIW